MSESRVVFKPDCFYHVFNKSVGDELLFKNSENYRYFLSLIKKHLDSFVNFYAYCLMPNHFHFLIQIKADNRVNENKSIKDYSNLISRKFGNVFNTYAQAFNKANNRKGSLFKNRFQRKKISEQEYLKVLIQYIHNNPIEAGLCENINDWAYSSYKAMISKSNSIIKKEVVIDWFGGIETFIFVHTKSKKND